MVSKIVQSLNSINNFSKVIIRVGSCFSFILCLIGTFIISYNTIALQQISTYTLGARMVSTSIVLFAQVVIGAIIIDYIGHMISGNDDD